MLCNAVRKLAEDFPDTVYSVVMGEKSCMYTIGTCGPGKGCIVGQAFVAAYPHLKHVAEYTDGTGIAGPETLLKNAGMEVHSADLEWLTVVQNKQDNGVEWSLAVKFADERLGLA